MSQDMNYKVNLRAYFVLALAPTLLVTALPGSAILYNTFWWQDLLTLFTVCGHEKVENIRPPQSYGKDRLWTYLPISVLLIGSVRI